MQQHVKAQPMDHLLMLNEVSSLWLIQNLQIPFKLILSTFFYIYIFFKALVCQIFTIPMGVDLKWCTITCNKTLNSFLLKERSIFNFLVIPKTCQTTESMLVVNFEIHLLPNCNCFFASSFFTIVVYLGYYNFCVHSFGFCPFIFKVQYMEWNRAKHRLSFWSQCTSLQNSKKNFWEIFQHFFN
jgi:hypothetical protein